LQQEDNKHFSLAPPKASKTAKAEYFSTHFGIVITIEDEDISVAFEEFYERLII